MDFEDGETGIMAEEEEEEDRLSNLPEDVIYRILSFLDMKFAVQTCTLSHKWKLMWTSIPNLNLNTCSFRTRPMFAKFVKHVLSQRNNLTEVSGVELTFTGATTQFFVKSIINYAYLHNIGELTITYSPKKSYEFPQCLFRSHTLKHLNLATNQDFDFHRTCHMPNLAWDFPALETLNLSRMTLCYGRDTCPNQFSKCVNLKNLTLHRLAFFGLEVFNICAPKLSTLAITDPVVFPKVFNVVAPDLENLTASVSCVRDGFILNLPTGGRMASTLTLSTGGFNSLDKVNLSWWSGCKKEEAVPILLDLFQKLRGAKILILDADIIQALSSCVDQLSREPCPFDNLKCLKLEKQKDRIATMPTQVRNYLLENSPTATVITDLPQPAKRSRQQVDTDGMAMKAAKLDPEQEQLERNKAMLESEIWMKNEISDILEEGLFHPIKSKIAELVGGEGDADPDYDVIRSVMDSVPENLRLFMEAHFPSEYQEVKGRLYTRIETELGNVRMSNSLNNQSDAQLPPAP